MRGIFARLVLLSCAWGLLGGQSVPVSVCVKTGGQQCNIWGKEMLCREVASYLRDTMHMPNDGRFFLSVSARTKQAEADAQRIKDLLRSAGYTNISEGFGRCGLAAESP
jgi:hypothetical protein